MINNRIARRRATRIDRMAPLRTDLLIKRIVIPVVKVQYLVWITSYTVRLIDHNVPSVFKQTHLYACNKRKRVSQKCNDINECYNRKTRNKSVKQSAHCKVYCRIMQHLLPFVVSVERGYFERESWSKTR